MEKKTIATKNIKYKNNTYKVIKVNEQLGLH